MKITKVNPRGFCSGVVKSWLDIKTHVEKNPNKIFYMIGWFVHNKFMVQEIEKMGVKIISDSKKSRYQIISELEWRQNVVLIFSAHGSDYRAIDLAKKKGFEVLDSTCFYVKKIQDIVRKKIKQNKKIIFYGSKKHPESISIKAIDPEKVGVCENLEDIKLFLKDNKNHDLFFTNQTTTCINDYQNIIKFLKKIKKNNIEIQNDICPATLERQNAIKKLKNVDLLIVVGDLKSNNSQKLKQTGIDCSINSILVSNYLEIQDEILYNKKHVAITSGASTPSWITKKVVKYVEKKFK